MRAESAPSQTDTETAQKKLLESAAKIHIASFAARIIVLLTLGKTSEQAAFFVNALDQFKTTLPFLQNIEAMEQVSEELWQRAKSQEDAYSLEEKVDEVQRLLITEQLRSSNLGYHSNSNNKSNNKSNNHNKKSKKMFFFF